MNDLFAIYRLSPDVVERFDATDQHNLSIKSSLEDSAGHWHSWMRNECITIEACRWELLRSIVGHDAWEPLPTMEELPTVARYLCMRVEQLVIAQEESS